MPSTREILDQIGAAVDDWEVSQDAMRQAPDLDPRPAPSLGDVARHIAHGGRVEYRHEPEPIRFTVRLEVAPFTDAMRQMAAALTRIDWARLRDGLNAFRAAAGREPQRSGPPPLCIDGHAYHHRTRARRRRR